MSGTQDTDGMNLDGDLGADVAIVSRIPGVPLLLEVVCRTTGMGFAAITRVTEGQWVACSVRDEIGFGIAAGGELPIQTTICNEIRCTGNAIVIEDVADDPVFRLHPSPAMYGFKSYISIPIILPGGAFFGTLCAIGSDPARINTPATLGMFTLFADLVAFHLDADYRLAKTAADLVDARQGVELREQFVAVLGHDLRNPLASISASAQVLLHAPLDDSARTVVHRIQRSVSRMSSLIDNVLDFARARLGPGIPLTMGGGGTLRSMLDQVVAEIRMANPDRAIEVRIEFDDSIPCDAGRIGQMVSNLVANAVTYGSTDGPIRVDATVEGKTFEISVANAGQPIPPETLQDLFKPFVRRPGQSAQAGLGLGLYIASQIALAHRGNLSVTSSSGVTRFTFRMPIRYHSHLG